MTLATSWTLLLPLVLLAACQGPSVAPPEPPQLRTDPEYPFGSATFGAHSRAFNPIWDALKPRYGKLRMEQRSMDAAVPAATIRAHYANSLGPAGWTPLPLDDVAQPGAWSFAYARGDDVVAVVGLARAEGGRVPVAILTNLPEARGR